MNIGRKSKQAKRAALKRKNETEEQRLKRLVTARAYRAKRIKNETSEQKEKRVTYKRERSAYNKRKSELLKKREYAKKQAEKRENETPEQREKRLRYMRERVAFQRKNESLEKKMARQKAQREYIKNRRNLARSGLQQNIKEELIEETTAFEFVKVELADGGD